jgi:hypothetical protein
MDELDSPADDDSRRETHWIDRICASAWVRVL